MAPLIFGWEDAQQSMRRHRPRAGTDKASFGYYTMYGKYLAHAAHAAGRKFKMLEIGLGCTMHYGPGKSVEMWRQYFGADRLELHELEIDAACVARWSAELRANGTTAHAGSQTSTADLKRLLVAAGVRPAAAPERRGDGQFDMIVDDGLHTAHAQQAAFAYLFPRALRPGGLYAIEDVRTAYEDGSEMIRWAHATGDAAPGCTMWPAGLCPCARAAGHRAICARRPRCWAAPRWAGQDAAGGRRRTLRQHDALAARRLSTEATGRALAIVKATHGQCAAGPAYCPRWKRRED